MTMTWIKENKLAASLAAVALLCTGVEGWLAFSSWSEYSASREEYTSAVGKLTKLNQQTPFPSEANKKQIQSNLDQEQASMDQLAKMMQSFRLPAFGDLEKAKSQDRPRLFQDALRTQVTAVKNTAAANGATLPPTFYLGMEEFENKLPAPEESLQLSKQLTALDWIAEKFVAHEGLILSEFTRSSAVPRLAEASKKTALPSGDKPSAFWESLGGVRMTFRCDQATLREILNAISSAPYFLVIESIQLQNSVTEPPRRNAPSAQPQENQPPADGQPTLQKLSVIVGREQINVSMRIRFLDIIEPQQSPKPVK